MTGTELKDIRAVSGRTQKDFYARMDVKDSYGSLVERHYANEQIPQRLEIKVRKRYKNLLKEE